MLEVVVVVMVIGLLGAFAVLATAFTANLLTAVGSTLLLLGLALGLPTGFWYHVVLYRSLAPRMPLRRWWWWSPSSLHRHLADAERRRIGLWYRMGGAGFGLCVAGGLTALAGLLMER